MNSNCHTFKIYNLTKKDIKIDSQIKNLINKLLKKYSSKLIKNHGIVL